MDVAHLFPLRQIPRTLSVCVLCAGVCVSFARVLLFVFNRLGCSLQSSLCSLWHYSAVLETVLARMCSENLGLSKEEMELSLAALQQACEGMQDDGASFARVGAEACLLASAENHTWGDQSIPNLRARPPLPGFVGEVEKLLGPTGVLSPGRSSYLKQLAVEQVRD